MSVIEIDFLIKPIVNSFSVMEQLLFIKFGLDILKQVSLSFKGNIFKCPIILFSSMAIMHLFLFFLR